MRLHRPRAILAGLVGGLTLLGLAACTPPVAVKADPISQPHAGYVMYPNAGKSYEQVHAYLTMPSFICPPKQTNTVRWFIAMDGTAGATDVNSSARAGLILGCRNGSPSYVPYYGVYAAGQNTPDKPFAPVRISQGDQVLFSVGQGFGRVEFQMIVTPQPGAPKRAPYHADIFVPTTQITGTAVGCLLDATAGAPALPKTTSFVVFDCSAYTDLAGNGVFGAPNHGNQATRVYNVSSKSGKQLTRLHTLDFNGLDGYFEVVER